MTSITNIPLCEPLLYGREWRYVKECLDTNWVSSVGRFVGRFESAVAGFTGTKYGVATSSGTAALHVALQVVGVRPDDEVLVPTLTFIAPVNAIRYLDAWPVFMDADPEFWQMDVRQVERFLVQGCRVKGKELRNRKTGRRVSALLPVHILGHPVDMAPLCKLARRYGLKVVEDATESLGALYRGRSVGHLGDIACFSFNGNKIITTGGGGMIVTDRKRWADESHYLTTQAKDDPLEYVHNQIGYNYRLTNIQAAVGCAQMEVLKSYIRRKRSIADGYRKGLHDVRGLTLMREAEWAKSTDWLFTVLINKRLYGMDSRELMRRLAASGIQTRPLWRPIHMNLPYRSILHDKLPVSARLYREALSLPSSTGLSETDQDRVISKIRELAR